MSWLAWLFIISSCVPELVGELLPVLPLTLYYFACGGCTLVACGSELCNPGGNLPGGSALFRGRVLAKRARRGIPK